MANQKVVVSSVKTSTLVGPVVSKLESATTFHTMPSSRVNKRELDSFRRNLMRTKNWDTDGFDYRVFYRLKEYAYFPKRLDKELAYLRSIEDDDGNKFSRCLWIYEKISRAMEGFASPDHTSFRWNVNYQKSLEFIRRIVTPTVKFKVLSYDCDEAIRDVLPKSTTHSGFMYLETGMKKKGDNVTGLLTKVEDLIGYGLEHGNFDRPVLPSYRSQVAGEYDDSNSRTYTCSHKHRVVSMVDLGVIAIELKWSKSFQEHLESLPCYAGGKSNRELSALIRDRHVRFPQWLSLDYSSYDNSISSWLIEDAFDIIAGCFEMSDSERKLFDVMVKSFIHKTFILYEGDLRSNRGVPSGSMWTQIIDTIVNLLMMMTYCFAKGPCEPEDFHMIAMGDDNLIQTRVQLDKDDIAAYISKNFGVKVNGAKSESGFVTDPKFLSREWTKAGESRPYWQVFSRMCFPERPRERAYTVDQLDPDLVIYAYILTYKVSMCKLIDVMSFLEDNREKFKTLSKDQVLQFAPGALAYILAYGHGVDLRLTG